MFQSVISSITFVIMANTLKLFQFFQKFNQTVGIQPAQQHWPSERIVLLSSASLIISSFGFLMFDAKSLFDYTFGTFTMFTQLSVIIIYILFIQQSEHLLKSIEKCEEFIEKSK